MIHSFRELVDTKILEKNRDLEEEKGPRDMYGVVVECVSKIFIVCINKSSSIYYLLMCCMLMHAMF